MTAILQMRPLVSAPHPEVSRLERLLRRKTFEIEILQEALDAARVKYATGSAPAVCQNLNRAIQRAADARPTEFLSSQYSDNLPKSLNSA